MKNPNDINAIRDVIQSILEKRFGDVKIVQISIDPEIDEYGEDVLFIEVVFDADGETLDPKKTSGLVRRIRPEMANIGEDAFPVLSFIAASEARKARPETT